MADIDFGQISEALNDKADRDIGNLNTQGRVRGGGLSFRSNKFIDLTLGASVSEYTAPADGFFYLRKGSGSADKYIVINEKNTRLGMKASSTASQSLEIMLPASKGQTVVIEYSASAAVVYFRFIYANGSDN